MRSRDGTRWCRDLPSVPPWPIRPATPSPGSIPDEPGVYRFSDAAGDLRWQVKSLRSRLNSYFADLALVHPRTRQLVTTATDVCWTVVSTDRHGTRGLVAKAEAFRHFVPWRTGDGVGCRQ
jgi:hypothetical protein